MAAHDEHVRVEDAAIESSALQKAAGQRKDARAPGSGSIPGRRRRRREVGPALGEQPVRLLQGEHLVDDPGDLGVPRLGLLGHAGADEHAAHVVAVESPHGQRGGDHRRDDRHEVADEVGLVLAHVLGDGRARRGDVQPVGMRLEVLAVGVAHEVCTLGDLDDIGEAGGPEGADDLRRPGGEARRERRREQGGDRRRLVQEPQRALDAAVVRLGVLGADQRAVAAGDAALGHDHGLAVLDADRLGGARAHTGVAAPAVLLDRADDAVGRRLRHERPPPATGAVAARLRST